MTDVKEACSVCTKDQTTKFCLQCGRNTRCPGCNTFVEFDFKFCSNCGHQLTQSPEKTSTVDKYVNIRGAVGVVSTGDYHDGDMTAYVCNPNQEAPEKTSTVDKSVNVGGAVGVVSTGDYHDGDMTAYVCIPNQLGTRNMKRLEPGAISKPAASEKTSTVDKSVNVGGAVGVVSTGDYHDGDMTAYVCIPNQLGTRNMKRLEPGAISKPAASEKTSTVDKSVNVGGAVGVVSTGDYHDGDMTAYVCIPNQLGTRNMKRLEPGAISKPAVNRSVNVGRSVGLVSTSDHHKGDMTAYIGSQTQGARDDSPSIKERELLGFALKQTSKSEMRKANDDSSDIEFHDLVSDLAKKVGFVWSPVYTGTAFRVGKDLIMTCWHVISGIIDDMREKHGIKNIYQYKDVWVQFDYKPGDERYNSINRFLFRCLIHYDQELDYAIVRLEDPTGKLPPPVTRFSHPGKTDTLHLIGHSKALHKKLDPNCVMQNPTIEQIAKCEEDLKNHLGPDWSKYKGHCYQGLEKDKRLRFHSGFVGGASGSPGAVRVLGGLSVVTMLDRGYPGFYFSLSKADQKGLDLPNGFFIEEGIDIMAIRDDIKKNRPDIFKLLFDN